LIFNESFSTNESNIFSSSTDGTVAVKFNFLKVDIFETPKAMNTKQRAIPINVKKVVFELLDVNVIIALTPNREITEKANSVTDKNR
jgi:hypothetical protein